MIDQIEIPRRYRQRARSWRESKSADTLPCAVCSEPVTITDKTAMIHVCLGGGVALNGDIGCEGCEPKHCLLLYPVGSGCLKLHRELRPFVRPPVRERVLKQKYTQHDHAGLTHSHYMMGAHDHR